MDTSALKGQLNKSICSRLNFMVQLTNHYNVAVIICPTEDIERFSITRFWISFVASNSSFFVSSEVTKGKFQIFKFSPIFMKIFDFWFWQLPASGTTSTRESRQFYSIFYSFLLNSIKFYFFFLDRGQGTPRCPLHRGVIFLQSLTL